MLYPMINRLVVLTGGDAGVEHVDGSTWHALEHDIHIYVLCTQRDQLITEPHGQSHCLFSETVVLILVWCLDIIFVPRDLDLWVIFHIGSEETQDVNADLSSRDEPLRPPLPGNEILELPANPGRPRGRPDLEDVVTQQTELAQCFEDSINSLHLQPRQIRKNQLQTLPSSGAGLPCHPRWTFQCQETELSKEWRRPYLPKYQRLLDGISTKPGLCCKWSPCGRICWMRTATGRTNV